MITYADVPVVGPYEVIEDPVSAATTPPVATDTLADSNPATYIEVDQYVGPSGVFPNLVRGKVQTGGTAVESRPAISVYARVQADGPLQYVRLRNDAGTESYWTLADSPPPIPSALGLLYQLDGLGLPLLNNAILGLNVVVSAAVVPVRTGSQVVRISELWLVAAVLSTDAPPARLFPREDGLGVGSGRLHPPPKSQQRSSRVFGYY